MSRPSKAVALALLAAHGQQVTVTNTELVEDVDGIPAGVNVSTEQGTLAVSTAALGWTQAELDDPEVTQ